MAILDEQVNIRISSEDIPLIEKVVTYRFRQGLIKKTTLPEYFRFLLNKDMTEVVAEIERRQK